MPLPEDEGTCDKLDVMFATTRGTVRRNKLSDFADVRPSGIIAMKLDEGDGIVGVQICSENDDVLLTAAGGQCIRFPVPEVRVFAGRTSMGVRGINLVTNRGERIRTRVDGIRIAGRSTQGVIVFDTGDDERVVAVERLSEEGEETGGA